MEAVENVLGGKDPATVQTPERVMARLSVIVEELDKGMMTKETALSEGSLAIANLPEDTLVKATNRLAELYSGRGEGDAASVQNPKMQALRSIIEHLPAVSKAVMLGALSPATPHDS